MVLFFIVIQVYECVLLNNVVGENEGGNRTNLKKPFNFLPLFTSFWFFHLFSFAVSFVSPFQKNNGVYILNSRCVILYEILSVAYEYSYGAHFLGN